MKKKLLFVLLILIGTAIIAYTLLENPHEFSEDECPKCHIDSVNNPLAMAVPITEMCRPCHKKMNRKTSHPVDMVPELLHIPEDLPLSEGMITCNTCHNVHEYRYTALGEKTYFLRRPSAGRDFCVSCHEVGAKNSHIELIASAHIGSRYTVTDKSQPLDPMSAECISCHDGGVGKSVDYQFGKGIWDHSSGAHPIGVNYRESRMRKGDLVPVSQIDKRIKFFGGKIGCGTCHNMYSGLPMQLVMSNERSALCFACHNK